MREYFTLDEKDLMEAVKVFRREVTAQTLEGGPCPLLRSQLEDLQMLCRRLENKAYRLATAISK